MHGLFPEHFVAGISRLSLNLRAAPLRSGAGVHLTRAASGASLAFRDYKSYTPGDDLRRVDWAVYGRTRHLFVRRFERPTAVPVFVLVDASRSMFVETPSRYVTAARVAAAVISAALTNHNSVYLNIADGRAAAFPRAITGRRGLVNALSELASDPVPSTKTIRQSVAALRSLISVKGSGIIVVVSDFFDPGGVHQLIDALQTLRGRLALLRVTQTVDTNPLIAGDLELFDCETDAHLRISLDAAAIERYQAAYRGYFAALDKYAASRGAITSRFDASTDDTLQQLSALFPAGVMTI